MLLSKEDRRYILNEHLRDVSHISNPDYQKRVWVLGLGPECQAFDDFVCDFFDEADGILDQYKEFGVSENQYQLLKQLRDRFEEFSDNNDDPEEFINTPEWAKIMNLAKDVLKAFNYKNTK